MCNMILNIYYILRHAVMRNHAEYLEITRFTRGSNNVYHDNKV